MHAPYKVLLISVLFTSGILLQGCSDNGEEEEPVAQNEATMEEEPMVQDEAPMEVEPMAQDEPAMEEEPMAQDEATMEEREGATETTSTERTSAPADAEVTIISPEDGATVTSPVTVEFGLEGMEVAEAGSDQENTGHHHLLVNVDELPPMDAPLPATDQVIHFGGGQTSTELELEPGEHTLQLLMGDALHVPHEPPVMSEKITITVE